MWTPHSTSGLCFDRSLLIILTLQCCQLFRVFKVQPLPTKVPANNGQYIFQQLMFLYSLYKWNNNNGSYGRSIVTPAADTICRKRVITNIEESHILLEADAWLGPKSSSKINLRRFSSPSENVLVRKIEPN